MKSVFLGLVHLILPSSVEVRKRRLELTVWAFLISLAFYPGYLGFLAWISLVRPLMILSRLKGRQALGAAYFFGFCFNAFTIYWVGMVTPPGVVAAVAIVALYYTAMLMIFNRLYNLNSLLGLIAMPFLWTGLEYFRTLTQFAFPWSGLGYTQSYYPYMLQIVSVISVHGLTFLIVSVNVLIWLILRSDLSPARRLTSFWAAVCIVTSVLAYGWVVTPPIPRPGTFDVAVLQGSVPVGVKWEAGNEDHSFYLYDSLSLQGMVAPEVRGGIQLYVWPETSAPSYLSHDFRRRIKVGQTARSTHAYHLVGALGATNIGEQQRYFNSCYLFTPQGDMVQRHDKVTLVPFSEQVPYQDYLPFLKKEFLTKYLTFIKSYGVQWWSDFYPGESATLFEIGDYRFGALICFESTFPEFSRGLILDGADFIVGITNDTWFGHSIGTHMHSRILITRAVENRCWMARAANSGLSYIVDGYGRIRSELPLDAVATLRGEMRPLDDISFFTRHGDIVGLVSFLITVSLAAIFVLVWLIRKILPGGFVRR